MSIAAPHDDAPRVRTTSSGRRRTGLGLVLLAGLVAVLLTVGVLGDHTLVWVSRLDHVFVLGVVALAVLGLAAVLLAPEPGAGLGLALLLTLMAVLWGGLGTQVGRPVPTAALRAPGLDEPYVAEVVVDAQLTTQIRVRQTTGLGARVWVAGCLDSDSGDGAVTGLRWSGPGLLEVSTDLGDQVVSGTVVLHPQTGRSSGLRGRGLTACGSPVPYSDPPTRPGGTVAR